MKYKIILLFFLLFSTLSNSQNDKVTFKKINNGKNFNFLLNDSKIGNYCKNGYMNNDLLVYYPAKKQLYICKDFKNKENDKEYNAELANINTENGFWFKTKSGGVHVYNENGVYIKKSSIYKYDTNKIDVIYRGQFEQNTLLLEHFKNVVPYTLNPIKLHEDSFKTQSLIEKLNSFEYKEVTNSDGGKAKGFFKNDVPNGPIKIAYNNGKSTFSNYVGSYSSSKNFVYNEGLKGDFSYKDLNKNLQVNYNESKKELEITDKNNEKTILSFNENKACLAGDCKNGIVAYKYENDAIYIGNFKNDKRDGFGKLTFKSGTSYIGEWKDNKKTGTGSYSYSNGDVYIGEWKEDKLHGLGAYYFKNSKPQCGIWDNGVYIQSLGKSDINYSIVNNKSTKNNSSNNNNSKNYSSKATNKVIRKTIDGLSIFPESGSLRTLSAEMTDMNATEYKLGNVGSYNGTPEGVAIISSCDLDRKVVFIKSTKSDQKFRGDYLMRWNHTEYYVSIINGKYQHEKVMFLGRDTHLTKTNKNNSSDKSSGYLGASVAFSWSMKDDIFTIKSNRNRNYKVNMSKCLKLK
ncbi:MORN repeat protein [Lutibacter sp. Hel_I_33_5]|uniref:MORN repeat-containing protein n=1 Tax=Lutibacter sp. Hel_I_33_5 TaxID=1566289 RepID=UPI0011A041AF|nr:hypothetical protein [Lutibacter sp. Hel_I_33_5]TVZ57182.1 MORN repeat protein [Lutibacter sp. Hel_I_33_5]